MGYDESWDCPHIPGPQAAWQESDCYWFFDPATHIGGFHRIGQKPNLGAGQKTLFVFKDGGERFVLSAGPKVEVPLKPDARQPRKQVVGGHSAESLGDGRMRFTWEEDGSSGDLEFYESFHTPRNWSKTGHSDKCQASCEIAPPGVTRNCPLPEAGGVHA